LTCIKQSFPSAGQSRTVIAQRMATIPVTSAALAPGWRQVAAEPFRLFFPLGVLFGLLGVSLWPLHFLGVLEDYPGTIHARIMAHGFFGSFILGFLGTALPRMLGTRPLTSPLVGGLAALQLTTMTLHLFRQERAGDTVFLFVLLTLGGALAARWRRRSDLPPPGFALAGMGLLCAVTGLALGWTVADPETAAGRLVLQSRLVYQGFLLLPVLGVGGFIFPGLLGTVNRHDLPESRSPTPAWTARAVEAGLVGLILIGTFVAEVAGWVRTAHAVRFGAAAWYLLRHVPQRSSGGARTTASHCLRAGLLLTVGGLLAVALLPAWRVALLHLTFASGLTMVTIVVATRVMFGHSGQGLRLRERNVWLIVAFVLMSLGTLTRITGDFVPKILPTHYSYGALGWAAGIILWAVKVLPAVLRADPED